MKKVKSVYDIKNTFLRIFFSWVLFLAFLVTLVCCTVAVAVNSVWHAIKFFCVELHDLYVRWMPWKAMLKAMVGK